MWLPGEAGRVSTLDLLGDGLTLFTGPGEEAWTTRRGAPPVTVRRLDAITARALGHPRRTRRCWCAPTACPATA